MTVPRRPIPGSDNNSWGSVLNTYLQSAFGASPFDYGAAGDGTTDDTAAVQAAANTGRMFLPVGTVFGITAAITPPTSSGLFVSGGGTGGNGVAIPQAQRSTIKILNGANISQAFSIPAGYSHGIFQNFEIDGNSANQASGTGYLIDLADAGVGEECLWKFSNLWVHNSYDSLMRIGSNRRGVKTQWLGLHVAGNGVNTGYCLQQSGSDAVHFNLDCSDGTNSNANIQVTGGACHFYGLNSYNATNDGMSVGPNVAQLSMVSCSLDTNAKHGLFISTGCSLINLIDVWVHDNSTLTNNGFAQIQCGAVGASVIITGGGSKGTTHANKPSADLLFSAGVFPQINGWTPGPAASTVGASMQFGANRTLTTTTTIVTGQKFVPCDVSGGAFTVTLPSPSIVSPTDIYTVYHSDASANVLTVAGTIIGGNKTMSSQVAMRFSSDMVNWFQV